MHAHKLLTILDISCVPCDSLRWLRQRTSLGPTRLLTPGSAARGSHPLAIAAMPRPSPGARAGATATASTCGIHTPSACAPRPPIGASRSAGTGRDRARRTEPGVLRQHGRHLRQSRTHGLAHRPLGAHPVNAGTRLAASDQTPTERPRHAPTRLGRRLAERVARRDGREPARGGQAHLAS